ncbi:hmp-2 [Pristionchus pacificus]|uniref:Hmp-2 n=1 Tax=Pristionchus pacificus TaxID=54126 RepID=A0A2A6BFC8_PRIPA|nr:hmp-2 [Pristionchus pacificus]|eukprot:PDM64587.1 hmp-2 [Pristionchus pacificus]
MATVASMRHVDLASEIHGKALNAVQDAYADTRWERVRGAIFSDFGHGSRTSRDTMVSRLAEPAKNVRRAIENLLALQRENDGKYTVEDLLRQMRSADQETVVRAVKHVYAVSKNDGSIATKEMIDELLRVTRSGDPELVRNAVGALSHISDHPNGRMFLFRSEGLAEIIRMLGSEDEAVVRYALTTLHRLLQHIESTRPMARQLGATPALTRLLEGWRMPKMLSMAADAVHILIFDDVNERNRFALDCDGARRLIRLLTTHEDQPKVVMTAVRCVRVLCAGQDASHLKHLLIEKDALFVLYTNLKKAEEARTRITILACLRNLSDAVSNEQDHAVIVIALLDIIKESERAIGGRGHLQGYSEEEVMFAAGVLSNLTCNNVNNKATVYEANGIGTLVDVLRLRPDKADEMVTEPALCTLRHSTARHGNSSAAQRAFARVDGWEVVVKQLETLRPPVVKAALGVVRNAAIPRENRISLVESRMVYPLLSVTMEILTSAAAELRMDVGATSDDGVSMWEIAEASGGALHQLAAHETVAGYLIEDAALLPVIKELLENPETVAADEVMQRELLGVLYQMSKTEEGCARIEGIELGGALQRALRSPHPSVVTYAAGVMKNLERGGASQRRFNDDGTVYGTGNWHRGVGGVSEYQSMGSELGDGYEPELFGARHAHNDALHGGDNYGLDRIDHSFRMPHNNSDWFDTDL